MMQKKTFVRIDVKVSPFDFVKLFGTFEGKTQWGMAKVKVLYRFNKTFLNIPRWKKIPWFFVFAKKEVVWNGHGDDWKFSLGDILEFEPKDLQTATKEEAKKLLKESEEYQKIPGHWWGL